EGSNVPERITVPWVTPNDRHPFGMISETGTEVDGMVFNREGTAIRPFVDGEYASRGRGSANNTSGGPESLIWHKANSSPVSGAEVVGRNLFLAAKYDFTDALSVHAQVVSGRSESNRTPNRADIFGINMSGIWAPRIAVDNAFLPDYLRETMIEN